MSPTTGQRSTNSLPHSKGRTTRLLSRRGLAGSQAGIQRRGDSFMLLQGYRRTQGELEAIPMKTRGLRLSGEDSGVSGEDVQVPPPGKGVLRKILVDKEMR